VMQRILADVPVCSVAGRHHGGGRWQTCIVLWAYAHISTGSCIDFRVFYTYPQRHRASDGRNSSAHRPRSSALRSALHPQETGGSQPATRRAQGRSRVHPASRHPDQRARDAGGQDLINSLFSHPYTKIQFIERELDVSRITATRYLDALAASGILRKHRVGRANYYVNLPLTAILTADVAEPAAAPG
jgi:hypothetical protein